MKPYAIKENHLYRKTFQRGKRWSGRYVTVCVLKDLAARRLIAEYGDRLYDTAFRLCQDESSACDLVNRTLWRAIERIGLYSGASSMYTWLYSILVNFWRMDLRQKKKMDILLFAEEVPECPDERPDPAETLAAKADSESIRNAVAQLPEQTDFQVLIYRGRVLRSESRAVQGKNRR